MRSKLSCTICTQSSKALMQCRKINTFAPCIICLHCYP
jgi:hypothetical protein